MEIRVMFLLLVLFWGWAGNAQASMIGKYLAVDESRLGEFLGDPESLCSYVYPEDENLAPKNQMDIDKAWHGIHYLLTGKPWEGNPPGSMVVMGGTEFGDDIGYGPARYLTPKEVKDVSLYLDGIDMARIKDGYNPSAMEKAQVYPLGWTLDPAGNLEYLMTNLEELVRFFRQAALRGDSVIEYLE